MSFYNIISKAITSKLSGFGSNPTTTSGNNAPLAPLMTPIKDWYNRLVQIQPGYDALALAMSSVPEPCDDAAEDDGAELSNRSDISRVITISKDSYEALLSGVKQSKEILAPDANLLCLTSVSGLGFSFQLSGDVLYCIDGDLNAVPVCYHDENGLYKLRTKWPSNVFRSQIGVQHNDILSILQRICNYTLATPTEAHILGLADAIWHKIRQQGDVESYTTVTDILQAICLKLNLSDQGTDLEMCNRIEEQVTSELGTYINASESFLTLTGGLTISGTINAILCDCCSSIFSHSWKQLGEYLTDKYSTAAESVRKLINRIKQSIASGGLRGFLSFLISVIQTQSSAEQQDGIMKFTDNSALLPREFIVGLVGQVISSIVAIVGAVISIIVPVLGAIISVIGMVSSKLFGSMKQNVSDTVTSIAVPKDEDESIDLLPCAPCAFFRGELPANRNFTWYIDYYKNTGMNAQVAVPGGILFIGPGSFDQSQNVNSIRFEFHPYCKKLNISRLASQFAAITSKAKCEMNAGSHDYRIYIPPMRYTTFRSAWFSMMNKGDLFETDPDNEATSGVCSASDDRAIFISTCACAGAFLMWLSLLENDAYVRDYLDNPDVWLTSYGAAHSREGGVESDSFGVFTECFLSLCFLQSFDDVFDHLNDIYVQSVADDVNWKFLVSACDFSTTEPLIIPTTLVRIEESSSPAGMDYMVKFMDLDLSTNSSQFGYMARALRSHDAINAWNYGDPLVLPINPVYMCSVPKYNRSTFWLWTALAVTITTAVAVGVAVASVKFSKWKKQKRLDNTIKANDARDDYAAAKRGFKYNESTGEYDIPFDTSSAEGQAYLQSTYKNYKSTVFSNNIQSHLIGGTRYDVSSFYGDSVTDEPSGLSESTSFLQNYLLGKDDPETLSVENQSTFKVSLTPVLTLISGN